MERQNAMRENLSSARSTAAFLHLARAFEQLQKSGVPDKALAFLIRKKLQADLAAEAAKRRQPSFN
jgi:hypothetical protein